jgi:hypothetical protein
VARSRVLLDACVPRQFAKLVPTHEISSVFDLGWGDLDDGVLLHEMEGRFDALVTVDRGLIHQQHIRRRPFGIVLMRAHSNRLSDLAPLASKLADVLTALVAGYVIEIGQESR